MIIGTSNGVCWNFWYVSISSYSRRLPNSISRFAQAITHKNASGWINASEKCAPRSNVVMKVANHWNIYNVPWWLATPVTLLPLASSKLRAMTCSDRLCYAIATMIFSATAMYSIPEFGPIETSCRKAYIKQTNLKTLIVQDIKRLPWDMGGWHATDRVETRLRQTVDAGALITFSLVSNAVGIDLVRRTWSSCMAVDSCKRSHYLRISGGNARVWTQRQLAFIYELILWSLCDKLMTIADGHRNVWSAID